jgi:hypothetical protein
MEWHLDGLLHREGGPAVDIVDRKEWWVHGKLHRSDGPAFYYHKDRKQCEEWWEDGQRHRVNGPAVCDELFSADGASLRVRSEWWLYDTRHREDGPNPS